MATLGEQLKVARRLLRVSQRKLAAAVERPFRAVRRAEAGELSGADVARLLRPLYERNGVEFGADGSVSLRVGSSRGLTVAAEPTVRLSGDVGGRFYRVELRNGQMTSIWVRLTETFGRRAGTSYWVPVFGTDRPGPAGKRLRPVVAEAEALLAKLAKPTPP